MTDPQVLISAYLDGVLSESNATELRQWINASDDNARQFVRLTFVHRRVYDLLKGEDVQSLLQRLQPNAFDGQGSGVDLEAISSEALLRETLEQEEQGAARRSAADALLREAQCREERERLERQESWSRMLGRTADVVPVRHYVIPKIVVYVAAAAILLLALYPLLHSSNAPDETPPIARTPHADATAPIDSQPVVIGTLAEGFDLRWAAASSATSVGEPLLAGAYNLDAGCVRVALDDGASVIIEGPAAFTFTSSRELSLESGKVVGRCPGGKGELVVHTPGATVIDIGTEFGVAVSNAGQTEVHVFEGSVDLSARSPDQTMRSPRRLTAGHARQVDRGGTRIDTIDHRELAFVRAAEFDANIRAAQGSAYHRWLALQYKLRRDPSLVAYYIMDPAYTAGDAIVNLAPTGSATDAIVSGAPWAAGRFAQTRSLSLHDEHALVQANIFSRSDAVTIEAWVKFDHLTFPHSGLIMSEQWVGGNVGRLHVGVTPAGAVNTSVTGESNTAWKDEDPTVVVAPDMLRQWVHLALVYDGVAGEYRIYCNGHERINKRLDTVHPIDMGSVQIGNWTAEALGWSGPNRVLAGCMQEICIFRRPLSHEEIESHYEAGRPETNR